MVALEAGEVVASQVEHRLPICKLGLGSRGANNEGHRVKLDMFRLVKRFRKWLRGPFVDELVYFLLNGQTRRYALSGVLAFSENSMKCLPDASAFVLDCNRVLIAKMMRMTSRRVRPGSSRWEDFT